MARIETDREDLMREATGLRPRGELRMPHSDTPVIAGFRSDDRCSLYFDADRCYHFDADGRLRRAFVDGHLYRTQGTTLARLNRERSAEQTTLLRHDLTDDELTLFVDTMRERVRQLLEAFENRTAAVVQVVPADATFPIRLQTALHRVLATDAPLAAPYPTRRR
ncbi:hypothetical protein [Maioricimonas rarisocia]|nr:hypothetical protein [Maioricimonas rarisocia]